MNIKYNYGACTYETFQEVTEMKHIKYNNIIQIYVDIYDISSVWIIFYNDVNNY